jgi:anti-sigma regulatory factor (Ser/Thr protein kinase)
MSVHPLRLAVTVGDDVRWHWLAQAVTMAGTAPAVHPPGAGRAPCPWARCPRVATRTPAPTTRSVGAAREFCLATLARWGLTERADDIAVVLSELLTNALRHGVPAARGTRPGWPVRVGLVWPARFVLCAVADPGSGMPQPREPDYFAESGRGLHVIDALSDAWGCTTPGAGGKTVWAAFRVGSTPPPARPPEGRWLAVAGQAAGPRTV